MFLAPKCEGPFLIFHAFLHDKDRQIKIDFPRENEGTERDIEGVGWDMSIPLKLFLALDGNENLFS